MPLHVGKAGCHIEIRTQGWFSRLKSPLIISHFFLEGHEVRKCRFRCVILSFAKVEDRSYVTGHGLVE